MAMAKHTSHILVIRLSAMGDVAMTVPVLRALLQQHPHLKITVLTRGFFAPFFRDLPNVHVFEADVKGKHKGLIGLYKLAKELKALTDVKRASSMSLRAQSRSEKTFGKIDAIADLHNVLRSKVLKRFLSGIPKAQIDKGRQEKKALVTGKAFEQLKTTHQRYADVFAQLGFPITLSSPKFPEPVKLSAELTSLLGTKTQAWIGIAPFAAHAGKMYPLEQTEQVIQALSKDYTVLLFGGGKQESTLLGYFETAPQIINLAGKLSLSQELDVISNLDLMLSMDSGNAHLAAMLGVKTLTLWGVTHPYAGFAPFNQPEDFCLLANRETFPLIPTSVYGNSYPEGYKNAAGSIAVETIVETVKSVL